MKFFFLFCSLAIMAIESCQSTNSKKIKIAAVDSSYIITGKITGLDSGWAYLYHDQSIPEIIDSAKIDSGFFVFKGKTNVPELYSFLLPMANGFKLSRFDFFVENGLLSISGTKDSINKAVVSGSSTQEEYKNFMAGRKSLDDEIQKLENLYRVVEAKKDKRLLDSLDKIIDLINRKRKDYVKEYVKQHPSSYVAAFQVCQNFSYNPDAAEMENIYSNFDSTIQHSYFGKKIKDLLEIAKKTAIGSQAPDFSLSDVNRKQVSLSSFKGKYILVDFWASWCGPCRRENPNLVEAFKKYHAKGFDILGVTIDENKDDWIKAIKSDKLTWTHVQDLKDTASRLYGVQGIPMSFLLDKEGKIVAKGLRGEELEKKLAELVK